MLVKIVQNMNMFVFQFMVIFFMIVSQLFNWFKKIGIGFGQVLIVILNFNFNILFFVGYFCFRQDDEECIFCYFIWCQGWCIINKLQFCVGLIRKVEFQFVGIFCFVEELIIVEVINFFIFQFIEQFFWCMQDNCFYICVGSKQVYIYCNKNQKSNGIGYGLGSKNVVFLFQYVIVVVVVDELCRMINFFYYFIIGVYVSGIVNIFQLYVIVNINICWVNLYVKVIVDIVVLYFNWVFQFCGNSYVRISDGSLYCGNWIVFRGMCFFFYFVVGFFMDKIIGYQDGIIICKYVL